MDSSVSPNAFFRNYIFFIYDKWIDDMSVCWSIQTLTVYIYVKMRLGS